jgi:Trp operon repressor
MYIRYKIIPGLLQTDIIQREITRDKLHHSYGTIREVNIVLVSDRETIQLVLHIIKQTVYDFHEKSRKSLENTV